MKVSEIKDSPRFHAPDQDRRIASILADQDGVTLGRAFYGKGMKAPFHTHQGVEYIHVIAGEGIFRTREREVIAKPGALLRFEPGEEHQLENKWDTPLEFVFAYSIPNDIQVLRDKWVSTK